MIPRLTTLATLFCLSLWVGAGITQAADIKISSGEHEDFSRLVLRFPDRVDWQFGRVTGGFEFRTDASDITYISNNIFSLIPRDRIIDVRDLGDGRLFIAVECACYGDAFDLRGGQIALDIKDGQPLAAAKPFNQNLPVVAGWEGGDQAATLAPGTNFQMAGHQQADVANASVLSLGTAEIPMLSLVEASQEQTTEQMQDPRGARQGLPLFIDLDAGAIDSPSVTEPVPLMPRPDMVPESKLNTMPDEGEKVTETRYLGEMADIENAPRSQRVIETEAALLAQISRAAAQGLLAPNTMQTQEQVRQANAPFTQSDPVEQGVGNADEMEPQNPTGPDAHVSIQSAVDRDNRTSPLPGANANGQECPPDYLFDVSHWGGEIASIAQIGAYRTGVLGEFDSVNSEAVLALARHYLFLTFGAETKTLIEQFEPNIDRADILLILAEIMDDQHSSRGRVLEKYLSCPGKVALWAALAQEKLEPGSDINHQAITAAFSELPVHLRRYLGPPLASRLIKIGETQTATSLRNAIDRVEGSHGPGVAYLDAQMAISHEKPNQAIAALEDAVKSDSDIAPNAVLELIEYKLAQNIEITEKEIANAASHAFEHRGSNFGAELATAEIMALAHSARFSNAYLRLSVLEERADTSSENIEEIHAFIVAEMIGKGSDAVFLRHILTVMPGSDLPRETSFLAAKRLAELGFFHDARELLGHSAQVPKLAERRLFAQIAIADGKFDVAMGYLAGLEDVPDLKLRALALEGAHDLKAAAQVLNQAGDEDGQLSASWRAGDWENVADLRRGIVSQASQLMIDQATMQENVETSDISLQSDAVLLTQAKETRDIVSQLLAGFAMP